MMMFEGDEVRAAPSASLFDDNEFVGRLHAEIEQTFRTTLMPRGYECFDIDRLSWLMAGITSSAFAVEHMRDTPRFGMPSDLLTHAVNSASVEGLNLEFGVFSGGSINLAASLQPEKTFFGFDSFQGLPDAWFPGIPKGVFARDGAPAVHGNVELVVGWFDETLPGFLAKHPGIPISYLHVDSDIYSSAVTIFNGLRDRIVPGTVILFDEYFNYPEWERHEHKAWLEFVHSRRLSFEYVGVVPSGMQLAVRVL